MFRNRSATVRNSALGFRSDPARIAVCTIASFDCICQNPSRFLSLMLIKVIVPHIPDRVSFHLQISRQNTANLKFKMAARGQRDMLDVLFVKCFLVLMECFQGVVWIQHQILITATSAVMEPGEENLYFHTGTSKS